MSARHPRFKRQAGPARESVPKVSSDPLAADDYAETSTARSGQDQPGQTHVAENLIPPDRAVMIRRTLLASEAGVMLVRVEELDDSQQHRVVARYRLSTARSAREMDDEKMARSAYVADVLASRRAMKARLMDGPRR